MEVDVIMASLAEWYALAFACNHDLHPERFLPLSLLVKVCQFAYVVHLDMLFAVTYFAGVVK